MTNHIDKEILESLRELNSQEEPNFLKDFMLLFLKVVPERIEAIGLACEKNSATDLANEAHALKSSCMSVGATQMTDLCTELENLAKAQTLETAKAKYAALLKEFETTKAEILALPELAA